MKILIIRTFPDILNLKSYNVQEVGLAKALVKKGHRCDIVLYNGKEKDWIQEYKFVCEGKELQFKIYWMHGIGFLKNGFMPSVKKIISEYDVIQVHEYDQIFSWQLYTKQKKPTIVYHGPYYDAFAKGYNLKCKIFDTIFLPLRKVADVVTVTKSKLATEFLKERGFQQIITAGVGINLDNFGVNPKEYPVQQSKKKNLLYVGKLEERRNIYFLIDVFRELNKRNSNIRLVVIGNGEQEYKEKFLKSIENELKEGSIVYREKATQKELRSYYSEASVFLLPSYYEIFGMVLLEAMYFGVPVVSSINGGSTTLIENDYNGFIMKEFNKFQWANCIQNIMLNKEVFNKIRENARRTIESGYTWEALADKFLEAYELAITNFGRIGVNGK